MMMQDLIVRISILAQTLQIHESKTYKQSKNIIKSLNILHWFADSPMLL